MCNLDEDDLQVQNINHMCINMNRNLVHSYPNVVGIGQGNKISNGVQTDTPCLSFLVENKIPSQHLPNSAIIPKEINGAKTDVVAVGKISSQPDVNASNIGIQSYTSYLRPAKGGISCAVKDIYGAGTLGCAVIDSNNVYILSNNHVLANSNKSKIGAAIYQPAYYEGGSTTQPIARLYNYKQILFKTKSSTPANRIDAAIGYVGKRNDTNVANLVAGGVVQLGAINGITTSVTVGQSVKKVGRTTEVTSGTISMVNASVLISYSSTQTALFTGQIVTSAMSSPGDSGSIGLDANNKAFGLLFAGSTSITIYNPIAEVLSAFNILIL